MISLYHRALSSRLASVASGGVIRTFRHSFHLSSHSSRSVLHRSNIIANEVLVHHHVPPLVIRTALVSSTVALCTPAFPAIGFVNLVLRAVLPEAHLRAAMSGAWGTLFTYAAFTLTPALYTIAPILLPFAIGNGVAAGATYALMDVTTGGPNSKILQKIYAGSFMGAVVGYMGLHYFYGPAFYGLYGMEGVSESIQMIMTGVPYLTFTSITTGAVAGSVLYPLLYFPTNGVKGIHWLKISAPALLGTLLAASWLYTPGEEFFVPEGAFVDPQQVPLLDAILRYNNATKRVESYSLVTQRWLGPPEHCEEGRLLAATVRARLEDTGGWFGRPGVAFDNRALAWMYYNFILDPCTVPNHVLVVKNQKEIKGVQGSMLHSDGIVGFIVERSDNHQNGDSLGNTHDALLGLLRNIDDVNRPTTLNNRKNIKKVEALDAASLAVELLFMLQTQKNIGNLKSNNRKNLSVNLEKEIRKKIPGVVIYAVEEQEGDSGESIETQLKKLTWKGGDFDSAMKKWELLSAHDEKKRWRDRAISTTAFALSLAGLFLIKPNR